MVIPPASECPAPWQRQRWGLLPGKHDDLCLMESFQAMSEACMVITCGFVVLSDTFVEMQAAVDEHEYLSD